MESDVNDPPDQENPGVQSDSAPRRRRKCKKNHQKIPDATNESSKGPLVGYERSVYDISPHVIVRVHFENSLECRGNYERYEP